MADGLRERKKAATRRAISEVATRMFMERGFEAVTIAEVAAAADVSVNTLFNYFGTKEDLFFDLAEEVIDAPSRLVRERGAKDPLTALRDGFHGTLQVAPDRLFSEQILAFTHTIDQSPALQARLHMILDQAADRLIDTLRDTACTADPEVLGSLVIGILRMLVSRHRRLVHAGIAHSDARKELLRLGDEAFTMLARS